MKICYKAGTKFVATIKAVHSEGVYIEMPKGRGAGVIPSSYWGNVEKRKAAMAAIHPGDKMEVVVRKYIPLSVTLSLAPVTPCVKIKPRHSVDVHHKPQCKLAVPGTVFLVDVANLLGRIGPEDAANRLRTINDSLISLGHSVALFLEYRTFAWLRCNQESEEKVNALRQFVKSGGVSLVKDEADLAILQCARQIPGSICVTNDKFKDYEEQFGDIVGTSRVHSFSWVKIDDHLFLSIEGLASAIKIRSEVESGVSSEECASFDDSADLETRKIRPDAPAGNGAVLELGHLLLAKGDTKKAFECFEKVARKGDAEGYLAMANAYQTGEGVKKDGKKADKYAKLAVKLEKKKREDERRQERKWSMSREVTIPYRRTHMSLRKTTQIDLAFFGEVHNAISEYLGVNRSAGHRHRAA